MKQLLVLGLLLQASASFAIGVTVSSFEVIRTGGGSLKVAVANQNGKTIAWVTHCNFKDLPQADQSKTVFTLKGADLIAAKAILENKAVLAQTVHIQSKLMTSGSWSSLRVNYKETDHRGKTTDENKEISEPLVLVDDTPVDVVSSIEQKGRDASTNAGVCK